MITSKYAAFAALALFASAASAQTTEIPGSSGVNAPPPVIWGSMNAFELKKRAWRQNRPDVAMDSGLLEQRARERQASLDRMRTRYAERMRETQNAGAPDDGSASVGPGQPEPAPVKP